MKASEYGTPVLGLIFLRFAETKFETVRAEVEANASARRKISSSDYHARRTIYLTDGRALPISWGCRRAQISARQSTRPCD
ncbi:MAG: type I restriction-modification system subunit M N-terminal domain-containing protein [Solirubrobacteraceae bacterium]